MYLLLRNKLLTEELRNFAWASEDQCVKGQDRGLNRSSTPLASEVLTCAYPCDIDPQTHSVKVFLISISHETEHEGKTSEFDLLTRPSSWPHLYAELQLSTTKVNQLNISETSFFWRKSDDKSETGRAKGAQKWCFYVIPTLGHAFWPRQNFEQNFRFTSSL